jgi:hypothetical protein
MAKRSDAHLTGMTFLEPEVPSRLTVHNLLQFVASM